MKEQSSLSHRLKCHHKHCRPTGPITRTGHDTTDGSSGRSTGCHECPRPHAWLGRMATACASLPTFDTSRLSPMCGTGHAYNLCGHGGGRTAQMRLRQRLLRRPHPLLASATPSTLRRVRRPRTCHPPRTWHQARVHRLQIRTSSSDNDEPPAIVRPRPSEIFANRLCGNRSGTTAVLPRSRTNALSSTHGSCLASL